MSLIDPFRLAACALLAGLSLLPPAKAAEDRRGEVLDAMAATLEARYLDEAKGRELAALMRTAREDGRFAAIPEPAAYAKALTEAMQAVSPDLHLRVSYEPDREFVAGGDNGAGPRMVQRRDDGGRLRQVVRTNRIDGRSLEQIAADNYGLREAKTLADGIGYLQLDKFVPADLSRDTLRAAVDRIADSRAVIVDLRGNRGGAPDAVGELLSPFFAGEARELHAAENRALGIRSAVVTDPALSRPALAAAPLYVLIDKGTASAAEMFAYAARRAGRATLVGAATAGAGNGGMKHSVGNGFALFLSEWKILTGPGWERVGVTPHVEVDPAQALDRALALARDAIAGRGRAAQR